MSPKSLLRHPKVTSSRSEFTNGEFQEVIADPVGGDAKKVKKLVLCSGKLYYDLDQYRDDNGPFADTSVVRVEQFYPFPWTQLTPYLNGFPNLKKVIWAQEEPRNMGAHHFVSFRIQDLMNDLGLKGVEFEYVGRTDRASPATGVPQKHTNEQLEILQKCFS